MTPPSSMRCVSWRPYRRGTLRGFASVELPIGLQIIDCPVHEINGRRWAALPGKAMIEDGKHRLDPMTGKPAYAPVNSWTTRRLRDAFSDRVVALVAARDPHAFDNDRSGGAACDPSAAPGGRP